MKEVGVVEKLDKNKAVVKVDKKDECSKCGLCLFSEGAKSTTFTCDNKLGAVVGDNVVLETEGKGKLLGAVLAFLVPLILIAISVLISLLVIKLELYALLLSLASVSIWYIILAVIDKKLKNKTGYIPVIVEIIKKETNKDE